MPPQFNLKTEGRILKAAARLWRTRGETGLTLRAVAREAGTSTPTVYKRFRDKQALRLALARQFRQQLIEECFSAPSLEEVFRRYVRFAEKHPNEYRILWDSWPEVFSPGSPRPLQSWFLTQLANRFGGNPKDYEAPFFGMLMLSHGAAMLLSVPGDNPARQQIEDIFPQVNDVILRNPQLFRE